jgi:hypothetical protein
MNINDVDAEEEPPTLQELQTEVANVVQFEIVTALRDGVGGYDADGRQVPIDNWIFERDEMTKVIRRFRGVIGEHFDKAKHALIDKGDPMALNNRRMRTVYIQVEFTRENGLYIKIMAESELYSVFSEICFGGVHLKYVTAVPVKSPAKARFQNLYCTYKLADAVPITFRSLTGSPIDAKELCIAVKRYLRGIAALRRRLSSLPD